MLRKHMDNLLLRIYKTFPPDYARFEGFMPKDSLRQPRLRGTCYVNSQPNMPVVTVTLLLGLQTF